LDDVLAATFRTVTSALVPDPEDSRAHDADAAKKAAEAERAGSKSGTKASAGVAHRRARSLAASGSSSESLSGANGAAKGSVHGQPQSKRRGRGTALILKATAQGGLV
jgi:hypothetical protein